MFLKADNSENEFNLKARLNVETKQNLRNALHKKTNMLMYLLRLSDMINTVLLLRRVTVSLFKIFFVDYTERFSSLTIHFQTKETCLFQNCSSFLRKARGVSWYI